MNRTLAIFLAFALAACGTIEPPASATPSEVGAPTLLAASDTKLAVGQTLSFFGGGFTNGAGHVELLFSGTYVHQSGGGSDPIQFTIQPSSVTGNQIDWSTVGPFVIPFGDGRTLGTFQGTVTAYNVASDGTKAASQPLTLNLQVMPSIVINMLQPVTAQGCGGPVKRLLGGFPYQLQVQAVGFTPVNFTYSQVSPTFTPPPLRHPATGQTDTFGQNNELYFPPVPDQMSFYITQFSISALATDGNTYGVTYSFGVHNPIEYIPTGPAQVAAYEQPKPVGGCIPGNTYGGQDVTYTDTETDDRTRNVGYSWDQSWTNNVETNHSSSTATTNGVSMSLDQGSNSSWTSGWSVGQDTSQSVSNGWSQDYGTNNSQSMGSESMNGVSVNGNASIGIPGIGDIGGGAGATSSSGTNSSSTVGQSFSTGSNGSVQNSMSKSVGTNGSMENGQSTSTTVGANQSTDDTESWALTQGSSDTVSAGSSGFYQVSSSSSIANGTSYHLLPGFDGWWYRQTTRLAYPGEVIAYDLCSEPTVAATAYFYDYVWAVSLAQGQSCTLNNIPIPSQFPSAQCFIGCNN